MIARVTAMIACGWLLRQVLAHDQHLVRVVGIAVHDALKWYHRAVALRHQRVVEVEERTLDPIVDEREPPLARAPDRNRTHRRACQAGALQHREHQILRQRAWPRDGERLAGEILDRLDLGLNAAP